MQDPNIPANAPSVSGASIATVAGEIFGWLIFLSFVVLIGFMIVNAYRGSKRKKIWWQSGVALVIVLSLGAWFIGRPYVVHKRCERFAIVAASNGYPLTTFELNNTYPGIYAACLNHSGL